jgi:hypothetical protein
MRARAHARTHACARRYHSFFAMGKTLTRIFKIMDHAAIYTLIAGSYTPYLLTTDDSDNPPLFMLMWGMAIFGVAFHACYSGRFKQPIETTCYLVGRWACRLGLGARSSCLVRRHHTRTHARTRRAACARARACAAAHFLLSRTAREHVCCCCHCRYSCRSLLLLLLLLLL